jgi:hypothetical protein
MGLDVESSTPVGPGLPYILLGLIASSGQNNEFCSTSGFVAIFVAIFVTNRGWTRYFSCVASEVGSGLGRIAWEQL